MRRPPEKSNNSNHHERKRLYYDGISFEQLITALDVTTFLIVFYLFTFVFGKINKRAEVRREIFPIRKKTSSTNSNYFDASFPEPITPLGQSASSNLSSYCHCSILYSYCLCSICFASTLAIFHPSLFPLVSTLILVHSKLLLRIPHYTIYPNNTNITISACYSALMKLERLRINSRKCSQRLLSLSFKKVYSEMDR